MGGCATKPKVLKGEEAEVPVPTPESVKEVPSEAKEVGVVEEEGGGKKKVEEKGDDQTAANEAKEIAEGEKAAEQEGKPRSLTNLIKNDGGKASTEVENASSEPAKEGESKEVEKPKEESETKQPEIEKTEVPVEKTPATEYVDASELTVAMETNEAAPVKATETTQSTEEKAEATESEEKKTEETVPDSAEKKTEEPK